METLDFKFKEEILSLQGKLEVHANNCGEDQNMENIQ